MRGEASPQSCADGERREVKATYGERSNGAEREQRSAVEPTFGRIRTKRRCGFRRWWRGVGRSLPAPRRLRRNVPTAGRDNTAMMCKWHTPFWWRWDASRILNGLLVAVLSHRLIRSLCSLRRLPFLRASGIVDQLKSNNRYRKQHQPLPKNNPKAVRIQIFTNCSP